MQIFWNGGLRCTVCPCVSVNFSGANSQGVSGCGGGRDVARGGGLARSSGGQDYGGGWETSCSRAAPEKCSRCAVQTAEHGGMAPLNL
jgi:hypothetical protein